MDEWEFRFKACGAVTAVCTALSIVIGGFAALYSYRQQGLAAEALKHKELRHMEYSQKREIYYELVDAAAAVSASLDKADAERNAARYWRLYYGKAHIAVIDEAVHKAKHAFALELEAAMKRGAFPTKDLQSAALVLARECRLVLRAQNLFSSPDEDKAGGKAVVSAASG